MQHSLQNKEFINLYWDIGKNIVEKQEQFGWGKSVVKNLSQELQNMKDNLVLDKSFKFAVRIVKLYKYLCDEKKNILCLNNFYEAVHQ